MSSTLCVRRTPKPTDADCRFKQPVKGLLARKFYDHDGSLGGCEVTIGPEHLSWFKGVLAAGTFRPEDSAALESIVQILDAGDTVDMWFEV